MASAPWARLKSIVTEQDLGNRSDCSFRLVLDFAGEEITTPSIPAEHGPRLALALLALGAVDERASVELPFLGAIRLGNLRDAGALLLALYPGALATDGLAGLAGVVSP